MTVTPDIVKASIIGITYKFPNKELNVNAK